MNWVESQVNSVQRAAKSIVEKAKPRSAQSAVRLLLRLMAVNFNSRPALRKYLRAEDGWLNFSVGFRTEDDAVHASISFRDGKVSTSSTIDHGTDTQLVFSSTDAIWHMLRVTPNEVLNMLMHNRLRTVGNFSLLCLFNFYLSLVLGGVHRRMERRRQAKEAEKRLNGNGSDHSSQKARATPRANLVGKPVDPGVKYLEDPYLSTYSLADFPRLAGFLDDHFTIRPEVCPERPLLMTEWFRKNGFEVQDNGEPWVPALRQAHALKHLLENRRPVIRNGDLLAGTTTSKDVGVLLFPDGIGTMLWSELTSVGDRELNPYDVDDETIEVLHREVFPYWVHRNFREVVRERHSNPLGQQLDERFAVYFVWKTVGISHTIPDFPSLLTLGTAGIKAQIGEQMATADEAQAAELAAMTLCLEGLESYADNLAETARLRSTAETDEKRRLELERLATICAKVPRKPAETLDEAVNAIWLGWVALHLENSNTGLSLGRLDQWLQPYFEADFEKLQSEEERAKYVEYAIELIGCLFMRCTDHLPLVPDIGNYLFGGASSDQAITLGGVTPEGEDAVNDMTYIFLKVTEMLALRDPNVNARFHPEKNSATYLKRLCEVNLITAATPSLHNDLAVEAALKPYGYPETDRNDWSATGCVEPTLSGRHMGHTGSILLSMVGALEMALNDGEHPLMRWRVGPSTGEAFETFESFFEAFSTQLEFLIEQATDYNYKLGEVHSEIRPTPLLSSLIDGCAEAGRDVTEGGAKHNTSGVALIGLADVTDSLLVIKRLVFDEERVALPELLTAVRNNFEGHQALHALVRKRVAFFGSGDSDALEMAKRVSKLASDLLAARRSFRGGSYTAGFWSMSNHVAFGTLAGALPSGRLAGKAFTPGLTPQPAASESLLDNIRDVAQLDPTSMANNMAFNVKVVPASSDTTEQVVDHMSAYVSSYFELGGMQMQMNVVTSDMLRDAMANPEAYRNLLVRISGYNAYFVTLNRDMQLELIERAEYGI